MNACLIPRLNVADTNPVISDTTPPPKPISILSLLHFISANFKISISAVVRDLDSSPAGKIIYLYGAISL